MLPHNAVISQGNFAVSRYTSLKTAKRQGFQVWIKETRKIRQMFLDSKIHCHVVKLKKLVELHIYSNKRPEEPLLEKPSSGLLMNILHAGNRSPMQECFLKNSMNDLLPALRFLGGLYNFCNFVIKHSLM